VIRAAAEWGTDPEVAEYNIYLARLNARTEAKERAKAKDRK
jgi:hypothetical protein